MRVPASGRVSGAREPLAPEPTGTTPQTVRPAPAFDPSALDPAPALPPTPEAPRAVLEPSSDPGVAVRRGGARRAPPQPLRPALHLTDLPPDEAARLEESLRPYVAVLADPTAPAADRMRAAVGLRGELGARDIEMSPRDHLILDGLTSRERGPRRLRPDAPASLLSSEGEERTRTVFGAARRILDGDAAGALPDAVTGDAVVAARDLEEAALRQDEAEVVGAEVEHHAGVITDGRATDVERVVAAQRTRELLAADPELAAQVAPEVLRRIDALAAGEVSRETSAAGMQGAMDAVQRASEQRRQDAAERLERAYDDFRGCVTPEMLEAVGLGGSFEAFDADAGDASSPSGVFEGILSGLQEALRQAQRDNQTALDALQAAARGHQDSVEHLERIIDDLREAIAEQVLRAAVARQERNDDAYRAMLEGADNSQRGNVPLEERARRGRTPVQGTGVSLRRR